MSDYIPMNLRNALEQAKSGVGNLHETTPNGWGFTITTERGHWLGSSEPYTVARRRRKLIIAQRAINNLLGTDEWGDAVIDAETVERPSAYDTVKAAVARARGEQ